MTWELDRGMMPLPPHAGGNHVLQPRLPGMTTAIHCCSDPFNFLLSVAGIAFVGSTLYDYHTTLRFVAVIGLLTTAVSVVTGYESAEVRLVSSPKGSVFGRSHALRS